MGVSGVDVRYPFFWFMVVLLFGKNPHVSTNSVLVGYHPANFLRASACARASCVVVRRMEGIKFVSKDEIDDAKKRKKEAEAARAAKEDAERKTKRAERKAVSMPRAERRPPTREHTRPDARAHTRSHAPARRVPIGRGEW